MLIQRLIRSLAFTSLFTLSMALAHLIGGGALTVTLFAPALFICSAFFLFIKAPNEFSGPALASLLLIFQIGGHLCFTMPHSDTRMSIAHAIAVFLSFHLVRHFEELIARIELFITQTITFTPIKLVDFVKIGFFSRIWCINSEILASHLFERAPPASAAA